MDCQSDCTHINVMSQTLTIRPTTRGDLAEIDALFARSYPALLAKAYPPSVLVTAIPLIAKANPALLRSGTYFAVCHPTYGILGAGGWTNSAPGTGRAGAQATGHIRHVVTDHRQVRQGIGRALMDHIFESAADHRVTRLECFSTLMAEPFYRACGFESEGPMMIELRPGIEFPAVRMTKAL